MSKALPLAKWLRYVAGNTKRLRLKHAWTQEALAEKAGLEARYVQEIERAKTNMTLAVLVDLATALGVHPRALLNEAEMKPAKPGRPRKGRTTRR
jgi:transcriptional regulator with XRE-family HTH domain